MSVLCTTVINMFQSEVRYIEGINFYTYLLLSSCLRISNVSNIGFGFHVCDQPYVLLPGEFQIFCEHDLKLDSKVELYDSIYKKLELFVDINVDDYLVLFSFTDFLKYYDLNINVYLHLNYIGNKVFLHKIFLAEGTKIVYERVLVDLLNNDGNTSIANDGDVVFENSGAVIGDGLHNGQDNLTRKLIEYDVQASCLVCFFL